MRTWRWTATTLVAAAGLIACGSVSEETPDASGMREDGGVSDGAASPDALASGLVTVTVVDEGGAPLGGMDVVFHAPDGTVLLHQSTNTEGQAEHEVEPDSLVTVSGLADSTTHLFTVAGVQPLDELVLEFPTETEPPEVGDLDISANALSGAGGYVFSDGCSTRFTSDPNATSTIDEDCVNSAGTASVLAEARDSNDEIMAFTFVRGVQPVDGGTANVTLPAWDTTVETTSYQVSNAPAAGTLTVLMTHVADGITYTSDAERADVQVGGGASLSMPLAGGFADKIRSLIILPGTRRTVLSDPASSFSVSGSEMLPPVQIDEPDLSNPSRPSASWTGAGSTDLTGVAASIFWFEDNGDGAWHFVLPPGTEEVRAPVLPGAVASSAPDGSSTFFEVEVAELRHSLVSWDEFRAKFGRIERLLTSDFVFDQGSGGRSL